MGIKEDVQQAQSLAKQGKLKEARNLLLAHDHPKVNELRQRIESAMAADNTGSEAGSGGLRGMALAVGNVIVSTAIVLGLATVLYNVYEPLGYIENEALFYGIFALLWLALVVIGHRLTKRITS